MKLIYDGYKDKERNSVKDTIYIFLRGRVQSQTQRICAKLPVPNIRINSVRTLSLLNLPAIEEN
jgi:hypothetical protein